MNQLNLDVIEQKIIKLNKINESIDLMIQESHLEEMKRLLPIKENILNEVIQCWEKINESVLLSSKLEEDSVVRMKKLEKMWQNYILMDKKLIVRVEDKETDIQSHLYKERQNKKIFKAYKKP